MSLDDVMCFFLLLGRPRSQFSAQCPRKGVVSCVCENNWTFLSSNILLTIKCPKSEPVIPAFSDLTAQLPSPDIFMTLITEPLNVVFSTLGAVLWLMNWLQVHGVPFLNISEIFLHPFTTSVIQDDCYIYHYLFTYYYLSNWPVAINFQ